MDFFKEDFRMEDCEIKKVEKDTELADRLLKFVENFSWEEVKEHTLWMLRKWGFSDWETMFVAMVVFKIALSTCVRIGLFLWQGGNHLAPLSLLL